VPMPFAWHGIARVAMYRLYTSGLRTLLRTATRRPPPTASVDWGIASGFRCGASTQAEPPSMVWPGIGALIRARRPPLGVAIENRNCDAANRQDRRRWPKLLEVDDLTIALPPAADSLHCAPRRERSSTHGILHDGSSCRVALDFGPSAADRQHS
jgi:hypothetical protein